MPNETKTAHSASQADQRSRVEWVGSIAHKAVSAPNFLNMRACYRPWPHRFIDRRCASVVLSARREGPGRMLRTPGQQTQFTR